MSNVLVIRLSALGDVALLVPVLYSVAEHYPDERFILITKSPFVSVFEPRPENVFIFPVYTKEKHKGIAGLFHLIRDVSHLGVDRVADVHNVLRSAQIRRFLRLKGKEVAVINKGRKEKRALTRKQNKIFKPLKSSVERYKDVFSQLGYDFPLHFKSIFQYGKRDFSLIEPVTGQKGGHWLGIAPFAKHKGKQYPLSGMEEVICRLSQKNNMKIFLFGGKDEKEQLASWAEKYDSVISVAGCFPFSTELLLMSYLDAIITMDSGNMHLASLTGTPVVSIWGATHPYAGFYGYAQDIRNAVQIDLSCRPCSVFGNKPCFRKDYACLNGITPGMIVEKTEFLLHRAGDNQVIL